MPSAAPHQCSEVGCPALVTHGSRCPEHARAKERLHDQQKGSPSARGYGRRWQLASKGFLRSHPLCQCPDCDEGRKALTPATVVDHVIPHRGDMALFWNPLNWQAMAKRCHDRKTWRETIGGDNDRAFLELRMPSDLKPSRIPLTIVCGPPGGGKSTYLREHAAPGDVVIDLDRIMQSLSGLPEHQTGIELLPKALAERNRQLRALATDTEHGRAWFVIAAPDPRERALWAQRLGARIELVAPPLDECIRRIKADPTRTGHTDRMIAVASEWWAKNERLSV